MRKLIAGTLTIAAIAAVASSAHARAGDIQSPNNFGQKAQIVDVSEALKIPHWMQFDKEEKAKQAKILINQAERLMVPAGIVYASDLVNTALKYDPSNFKAQFYSRLLAPTMELQGLHRRLKEIAEENASDMTGYNSRTALYNKGGMGAFLLGGSQPAFKNERDIQKTTDRVVQRLDELRQFIRRSKSQKIKVPFVANLKRKEVTIPGGFTYQTDYEVDEIMELCNVEQVKKGVFKIAPCSIYTHKLVEISRTDWELLQGSTAGLEAYLVLASAYDLSGGLGVYAKREKASRQSPFIKKALSNDTVFSTLKTHRDFGKLRNENKLFLVPELGSDTLSAFKWLKGVEKDLCRQNESGQLVSQRREGYLFGLGACIFPKTKSKYTDFVLKAQLALRGSIITVPLESRDSKKIEKVYVQPMALVFNPPVSIEPIVPNQFNRCGKSLSFGDDTLGGIFGHNNASTYLLRYDANVYCR